LELAVDLDAEDIARGQLEGLAPRAHDGPSPGGLQVEGAFLVVGHGCRRALSQLEDDLLIQYLCCARHHLKCHVATRIQQAIELRTARVHVLCHAGFVDALPLHLLRNLPSDDGLDGRNRGGLEDTFLLELSDR
jgi:hypothetical protein